MNLIFCAVWCCLWYGSLANGSSSMKFGGIGEPNIPILVRSSIFENKWFEQKLDHFNPIDTRTWKQRYQMNLKYYKYGGPVFLHIGGEDEISHNWMNGGAWIEYAQKCNALCFQLEHRYYGRSHPTDNLNTTNLLYLNIEQALADVAEFINTITNENENLLFNAKWVVFGGSYAGNLAAWARMKYPHLIHAAVSSSSTLGAAIDYNEYYTTAQTALSDYNPKCASHIKEATGMINDYFKTNDGAKYIDKKFKTCEHVDITNKKDLAQFFDNLAIPVALIMQYNKDNRYYENVERSTVSIRTMCGIMLDKSLGNALERYSYLQRVLRTVSNRNCTVTKYQSILKAFKETSWKKQYVKSGDRQWLYQTCTELGHFVTSNKVDNLFGNTIPLDYFTEKCRDVFGKSYNLNALYKAVKNEETMFNYLKKKTSRVIYLHGSIDPWNKLGLTQPQAQNSVSIFTEGVSHCADLYPSASSDPPQLTKARKTVLYYLQKWLTKTGI
ncbi:putative serine protease K12H4.7 [Rhopalosiphum maidis]|uniref:putative serine protease K12H4.7 n=1 Tax=Rhopalosiphum maidis TaxID=43146 RepID=UPI000EFFFD42|nr:putative serine protease K12H4.7 [Rhopalosiphum maidis]